jgi:hypothetical protein
MDLLGSVLDLSTWWGVLLACAVALAALALVNVALARWAERKHPPTGSFVEVDGVRLHYTDRGTERPVVLLHGNAVTGADYDTSGVAERLVGSSCRVVVFDRPGFGHSDRPRGRTWTAEQQADLLHQALARLDVGGPWWWATPGGRWSPSLSPCGTRRTRRPRAAVRLLLPDPAAGRADGRARGGARAGRRPALHRFAGLRLAQHAAPQARHVRALAGDGAVQGGVLDAMALRPSQIRATAEDGRSWSRARWGCAPATASWRCRSRSWRRRRHRGPQAPSRAAARRRPGQLLGDRRGSGHMVHHVATDRVVEAVAAVVGSAASVSPGQFPRPASRAEAAAAP